MSLDGLRAWIGEVERKLGMRTRVFLALAAIAIGVGGAAMYLAIDTRGDAVSEGDVQELQAELEAQIEQLRAEEAAPGPSEGGAGIGPSGADDGGASGDAGGSDGSSDGGARGGAGATGGSDDSAKLKELLERAREQSEANE